MNPNAAAGTTFNAGAIQTDNGIKYRLTDSFENGGKYLLVGELALNGGDPIAYVNNNIFV